MNYEIDILDIGTGACGDSIAIRFGDLNSADPQDHTTILIDGGFKPDHVKINDHFTNYYGHNRIDLVVSTHPDQDHINGLSGVLDNMNVSHLWMHLPWSHSDVISDIKQNSYVSERLNEKLANSLKSSDELSKIAINNGVPITEPFSAETSLTTPHGKITVIGPSRDYYKSLLGQFIDWRPKSKTSNTGLGALEKVLRTLSNFADETFNLETLSDSGSTSPQNNSSAVILIGHDNKKFLFTGDAGIEAIELACAELEYLGHPAGSYTFVQVPHHGSRQNVGPTILNRLLGDKLDQDGNHRGQAYVSSAKDCDDHPKKSVMNAFRRRGFPVTSTQGSSKVYHNRGTQRPGWSTTTPHPIFANVEEE